jgi:hypothetical protein
MKRIDVISERPVVKPSMQKITRTVKGAKIDTPSPTSKAIITRAISPIIKLIEFVIADAKEKT